MNLINSCVILTCVDRFWELVDEAIDESMIAPISQQCLDNVYKWVPQDMLQLKQAKQDFLVEMDQDYKFSTKKGMLDYVLLDDKEQERLGVVVPFKVR